MNNVESPVQWKVEKVEIVKPGSAAMLAGQGLTRIFRRQTSGRQQYFLMATLAVLVIGAMVWNSLPEQPVAPAPNVISGHLSDDNVSGPAADLDVQEIAPEELGGQTWHDSPETLLRQLRFTRTDNAGQFGSAELWLCAPDGLWEMQEVRLGDEVEVDSGELTVTVVRIDTFLVLVRDADGVLHRVFNPRYWPAISMAYHFEIRPFSDGMLAVAKYGFWTVQTGTRRLMGVDLVGPDGGKIPDWLFVRYVKDLESLYIRWKRGDLEGRSADLVTEWLAEQGFENIMVAVPE